jgi:hypothetical protein
MNDPREKNFPPPDYGHQPPPPGSVISGGTGVGGLHPPPQTSITLNTDPAPGAHVTEINLNLGYFKTLPGILKLVQMVSDSVQCDLGSAGWQFTNIQGTPSIIC